MSVLNALVRIPLGLFRSSVPIPDEHRSDFRNLYFDIGWFGLVNGSVLSFLSIYLARIGASGTQIGLVNAAPAITGLFFVLIIGKWLDRQPIRETVFITSIAHRLFYIPLIFLPLFLSDEARIWAIILLSLLMYVPGTALTLGFNTMFADLVPPSWRGYVAGVRNALLSIGSSATTMLCGWLLVTVPFPTGYQVVFLIGTIGSFLSSLHLYLIARPARMGAFQFSIKNRRDIQDDPEPVDIHRTQPRNFRSMLLGGPFGRILMLLFFFHLTQYLPIPVFPLYAVHFLKFSDQIIGIHTATFSLAVFLGSSQIDRLSRRLGNRKLMGLGIIGMGSYPVLLGLTSGVFLYILAAVLGGIAWAMAGGVLFNYLYEKIPETERSVYLAWYSLFLNAAVVTASLAGPAIASAVYLPLILIIFGLLRSAAGAALLIWG